jgi:hypothetical protein
MVDAIFPGEDPLVSERDLELDRILDAAFDAVIMPGFVVPPDKRKPPANLEERSIQFLLAAGV